MKNQNNIQNQNPNSITANKTSSPSDSLPDLSVPVHSLPSEKGEHARPRVSVGAPPRQPSFSNSPSTQGQSEQPSSNPQSEIQNPQSSPIQFGKPRSDSILYALSAETQARVTNWLFNKNLSFIHVANLCQSELNLTVSKTSVRRFYRRELRRRNLDSCLQAAATPPQPSTPADPSTPSTPSQPSANQLYLSLLDTAASIAQNHSRGELDPQRLRVFTDCLKLLIASRREAGYSRRTDLARLRFEFDAATACVIRQLQINEILADEELTDEERIRAVREELFGPGLPE